MIGVAVLLAAALLAWPGPAAADRLRALAPAREPGSRMLRRLARRLPAPILFPLCAGVVGLLAAGPLHACAAALLGGAAADLHRRATARRADLSRLGAWERALDDASSALRAGAGPALALQRAADAAEPCDPRVAAVLTSAGAHARLGGDVAAGLVGARRPGTGLAGPRLAGSGPTGVGPILARPTDSGGPVGGDRVAGELAGAWLLATRHGVVLADVVDGLRADVASRRERAVRVGATLAGPRATAVILTALPGFGVLLGSGFGANPLGVLLDGPLGGALCLAGAVFLAAGLLWTDRIAGGAVR